VRVMRRRMVRVVPLGLLALVAALIVVYVATRVVASPPRPDRPVLIASGDWEPFVGPDLPDGGPVARLVTEVLARQGYAAQVSFTTWPLALQRSQEGTVVGAFPFVGSAERREDYLLSAPLLDFDYVLFVDRRTASSVRDAADLSGLRVAHISGYDYWPELDAAVDGYQEYPSKEAAFAALVDDEVDVVPEGLLSGRAVLASPTFPGDEAAVTPLDPTLDPAFGSTEALHLMLPRSADNAAFLRQFDGHLADVRADELYASLVASVSGEPDVVVELVTPDGRPPTLRDPASRERVQVLRGTRAVVTAWPAGYGAATTGAPDGRLRVKVLDGPNAGRVLQVAASDVSVLREEP
jgi:polar amino acid transport system substrate-binding protein